MNSLYPVWIFNIVWPEYQHTQWERNQNDLDGLCYWITMQTRWNFFSGLNLIALIIYTAGMSWVQLKKKKRNIKWTHGSGLPLGSSTLHSIIIFDGDFHAFCFESYVRSIWRKMPRLANETKSFSNKTEILYAALCSRTTKKCYHTYIK